MRHWRLKGETAHHLVLVMVVKSSTRKSDIGLTIYSILISCIDNIIVHDVLQNISSRSHVHPLFKKDLLTYR